MTKQVIALVGGAAGAPITNERIAAAAGIIAGHLVEESGGQVQVHGTAAGSAQKLFAMPNLANSGDADQAYLNGETVIYGAFHAGQEVNALVAAAAPAIADGDALESAGDGTLRKAVADAATDTAQRNSIVGYAMESVDNSAGGSAVRIKVRVA